MCRWTSAFLATGVLIALASPAQALDASAYSLGGVKPPRPGVNDAGIACRQCLVNTGNLKYKSAKGGSAAKQQKKQ